MSITDEVFAVRSSVALTRGAGPALFRLSGADVFAQLDALCPAELFVQDGQMLQSLLLDDDATIVADVCFCADGDDFLLLADGLAPAALREYLEQRLPAAAALTIEELGATRRWLSLNGPYAWELLAAVLGPEVIGLPYLGFYHGDGFSCFRAGRTGEYGYELFVDARREAEFVERVQRAGAEFDLRAASVAALELCALENWSFTLAREGRAGLTPIELQLQWRLSYQKSYPGSARLCALRAAGPARRAVLIAGERPFHAGDGVEAAGLRIGTVLAAERSPSRGDVLGIAVLALPWAHPGLGELAIAASAARVRVLSAPAVNNRSLFVDPQRHGYATRDEASFPALSPARVA